MKIPDLKKTLLVAILALPAIFPALSGSGYDPPEIRVKVGTLQGKKEIKAEGLSLKRPGKTGKEMKAVISWDGKKFTINGKKYRLPITFSAAGPIYIEGAGYRGKIALTDDSPPRIVNAIDVESYVAGVLNNEINARWPENAVDAQAILARTYALKKAGSNKDRNYDLDSTTTDQVYGGLSSEDGPSRAAVKRTRGQVLYFGKDLADGLYHSCCGGKTEKPSEIWGGEDKPYQKSVPCSYCQDAPRYFWRYPGQGAVDGKELARALSLPGSVGDLEIIGRGLSGRVTRIKISYRGDSRTIKGTTFRDMMGHRNVFSTNFQVDREEDGWVIRGSGSGHGAGMCQWGARGMAETGFSVEAILRYYFPGTTVSSYRD